MVIHVWLALYMFYMYRSGMSTHITQLTEDDIAVLRDRTIGVDVQGATSLIDHTTVVQAAAWGDKIPNRHWRYVGDNENLAWTWESDSLTISGVAGVDADDPAALAQAINYVLDAERRTFAREVAYGEIIDVERAWAIKQAARLGKDWKAKMKRRDLANRLASRNLLTQNEIEELVGDKGAPQAGIEPVEPSFDRRDIVRRTGLTLGTIDRYISDARLPLPITPGRWDINDIEAWHQERRARR